MKQLSRPVVQDQLVWKYKPNLLTVKVLFLLQPWPDLFYSRLQLSALKAITHQTVLPLQTLDNTKVNTPLTRVHLCISAMPNSDVSKEKAACHPSPPASISPQKKGNSVQQAQVFPLILWHQDHFYSSLSHDFLLGRALNIVQNNYSGRKHSSHHVLMHIYKPVLS